MEDDDLSWMKFEDGAPVPEVRRTTVNKKRSKLIMLDDLVREREKKTNQKRNQQSRYHPTFKEGDGSSGTDDDEDDTADMQAQMVKQMLKDLESESIAVDEKVSLLKWGEKVFYSQTPFAITSSGNSFVSSPETNPSTEGLLLSGMLRCLVIAEGQCDEKTTRWAYLQMIQSPNELLEKTACQFLCDLLILERADSKPVCRFEWVPNFTEIMDVFRSYGYRKAPFGGDVTSANGTGRPYHGEMTVCDPASGSYILDGPPPNIRSFVAFLIPLFQTRPLHEALSPSEAEQLAVTLAHSQMDRRIEDISPIFRSCLDALVHYFTDEEWAQSCPRIASSFSSISSSFLNQVRAAKSLHAGDSRLCSLQRLVVVLLLGRSVKRDMKNAADVVSVFKLIKTKNKDFDFLNLFHQLTSADMYLWSEPGFQGNGSVHKEWLEFLKRITLNISSTDERPHATKARNWASFLYQKYQF